MFRGLVIWSRIVVQLAVLACVGTSHCRHPATTGLIHYYLLTDCHVLKRSQINKTCRIEYIRYCYASVKP